MSYGREHGVRRLVIHPLSRLHQRENAPTMLAQTVPGHAHLAKAVTRATYHGRVLVVDDDDLVRFVVARGLGHHGFEVVEARDGLDALASVRAVRPDLILTDYNMPRCNGERLCVELKRDPATTSIPIVLMTGGPVDEPQLRASGCADILYKPLPTGFPERVWTALHERAGSP